MLNTVTKSRHSNKNKLKIMHLFIIKKKSQFCKGSALKNLYECGSQHGDIKEFLHLLSFHQIPRFSL